MKQPVHLVLRDRDLLILKMAFDYRGITAEHVSRRFFPTPGARSACYARLARLVEAGYLTSVRLPALSGVGSGKAFLTPGPAARPLLSKMLGISRTELGRLRLDSPFIIHHHLALCDVRLAQEIADTLAFRWQVASGGGQHPFEAAALQALYEHSEGIPREATILADNALLLGFYRKQLVVERQVVEDAAADRRRSLAGQEVNHGP